MHFQAEASDEFRCGRILDNFHASAWTPPRASSMLLRQSMLLPSADAYPTASTAYCQRLVGIEERTFNLRPESRWA